MAIEIIAVGGYGEVGKSMTAIKIKNDVVILDMGLHLPNYIRFTEGEREDVFILNAEELRKAGAIPDDKIIEKWRENVRVIIPTHAHLDHCGAVPFLAPKYDAPVACTRFTAEVIKKILKDEKKQIPNKIIELEENSKFRINKDLEIEFIYMTHSTPQTVIVAIHSTEGIILYANEFKLDNSPTLGKKPNYDALKKIKQKGVKITMIDSLYAHEEKRTPSESVAKEMLRDVLIKNKNKNRGIIVTTFSSHIARLKTITEFGRKLGRKVVILGRAMSKYCYAAEDANVAYLSGMAEIIGFKKKIIKKLQKINREGRHKYLIITTGHQGEPNATLTRIASKNILYPLSDKDDIIFSCNTIPTPINIKQRRELEAKLKQYGVRLFTDVHISGHPCREDIRELIDLVKPEHIIPSNGPKERVDKFIELAEELGYKREKNLHVLFTSQKFIL